jgi:hypothetical protein
LSFRNAAYIWSNCVWVIWVSPIFITTRWLAGTGLLLVAEGALAALLEAVLEDCCGWPFAWLTWPFVRTVGSSAHAHSTHERHRTAIIEARQRFLINVSPLMILSGFRPEYLYACF